MALPNPLELKSVPCDRRHVRKKTIPTVIEDCKTNVAYSLIGHDIAACNFFGWWSISGLLEQTPVSCSSLLRHTPQAEKEAEFKSTGQSLMKWKSTRVAQCPDIVLQGPCVVVYRAEDVVVI